MHAQKIAAHAVCGFQRAEVFLIIVVELAAQMQPNLVQQHGPLELCRFCFLENQEKATFGVVR
jgi:hypothetical protein